MLEQLQAAISSEVAWSPTTPLIILIFNQDVILHSFPPEAAISSHAWEIEQPAEGLSGDRPEGVWTERQQSRSVCFCAHKTKSSTSKHSTALAFLLPKTKD